MYQPDTQDTFPSSVRGLEVGSIIFVRDYLQISLDGPGFTLITWPRVKLGGKTLSQQTPGYRDALCQLIGKTVVDVAKIPHEQLTIVFSENILLEVSLKDEDRRAAEAATYHDQQKVMKSW
jgi:hypothetical protein